MSEYSLAFTPLATELAKRHHTLEAVEAEIRREVDGLLGSGLKSVNGLGFTTVVLGSYFDDTLPHFIVSPNGDDTLRVDSAEYEDHGELDAGPLKGFKVSIPVADGR
jgi:hypothetical protein